MAQQTAVEWLSDNLIGNPYTEEDFRHNVSVFQQAKQMEKEQIINAYYQIGKYHPDMIFPIDKDAEQYYNETYNK